jgi:hypothetical protein
MACSRDNAEFSRKRRFISPLSHRREYIRRRQRNAEDARERSLDVVKRQKRAAAAPQRHAAAKAWRKSPL